MEKKPNKRASSGRSLPKPQADQIPIQPHHPHDSFFRRYFSRPEVFASLLREVLPPDVFAGLNLATLTIEPGTYVDSEYHRRLSDLAAEVSWVGGVGSPPLGEEVPDPPEPPMTSEPIKIYLLAEHKSYNDSKVLLQLLRYMVQTWDQDAKTSRTARLTPIIPILFHHGPNSVVSTDFAELFPSPLPVEIRSYIPRFDVAMANITGLAEEDFPTDPALAMAYWSFRYAQTDARRTLSAIARIAGNLKDLEVLHGPIEDVSLYFTSVTDLTLSEFLETINKVLEDVRLKESFMGARDTLLLRSMRESKQEGITEVKRQVALKMTHQGRTHVEIADLLDLSQQELQELLSQEQA